MLEAQFDKIFDTQTIYRLTLDAMARPGKINTLPALRLNPPTGLYAGAAAVALTLLDSEVSFCLFPSGPAITEYLAFNTGAALRPAAAAEFIIFSGDQSYTELNEACCGTLASPEQGATLIIMVERLSRTAGDLKLQLSGPGIKGGCVLFISGLNQENLAAITRLNGEFPLGLDVIYTDRSGNVACVPRSSSLRWEVVS